MPACAADTLKLWWIALRTAGDTTFYARQILPCHDSRETRIAIVRPSLYCSLDLGGFLWPHGIEF
jgi:hypothetical protein